MFETRLGILVQTLIWETSKHGQRGAILLGGRELVRGLRGTRTFHLFHLFYKFPWIFAWFGFVGVALFACLFLLAFAFGEICFLSSPIPVVDRQCLALVRQCRKKKGKKKKEKKSGRSKFFLLLIFGALFVHHTPQLNSHLPPVMWHAGGLSSLGVDGIGVWAYHARTWH